MKTKFRIASRHPYFRLLTLALIVTACSPADDGGQSLADAEAASNPVAESLVRENPSSWVGRYDPSRSSGGYNLVLYRRRMPVLIDMNGHVLHSWPDVKATGRARLTKEGHLVVISLQETIRSFDWEGALLSEFTLDEEEDFFHHDLRILANGNLLLLARSSRDASDYILEVDSNGEIVWEWYIRDHLERHFSGDDIPHFVSTHVNSVFELPPNRHFDKGDQRFRPGNILVSARNLNTIFIIDRQDGEIVWTYSHQLVRQHEATMVPQGWPGDGDILVFNNHHPEPPGERRSTILQLDAVSREVVWQYSSPTFFSSTGGVQQILPNGNILITSSQGGRLFEIDRSGEVVWQWVPPYLPMRAERYPYDFSRRFAAWGKRDETAVTPKEGPPYLDRDLYNFAWGLDVKKRRVAGKRRPLLVNNDLCRTLTLPNRPQLLLAFGIDRKEARKAGLDGYSAEFKATLRPIGEQARVDLVSTRISQDRDKPWTQRRLDLTPFARQRVELCLETEESQPLPAELSSTLAVWVNPRVRNSGGKLQSSDKGINLTAAEQETLERQLRALGYMN